MKKELTRIFQTYLKSSSQESLNTIIQSIFQELEHEQSLDEKKIVGTPEKKNTAVQQEASIPIKEDQEKEKRLHEIRKSLYRFTWWDPGEQWNIHRNLFLSSGGTEDELFDIKNKKKAAKKCVKKIQRKILDGKITHSKKKPNSEIKNLRTDYRIFINSINKDIQWAVGKRAELVERKNHAKSIQNLTIHPSRNTLIHQQDHAKKWFLLIDESGSSFSADKNRIRSCFVGVLMPATSTEEPIEIHATDDGVQNKAHALNRLMQQKEASILGLRLKEIPKVHGEQWIDGVTELIGWVMRLLPYEDRTTLHVCVEQRLPHQAGSEISRLERMILQSLVRVSPSRANEIQLHIQFVKKYNSHMIRKRKLKREETHEWLAFADIAAYLWNSNDDLFQSWIQTTKLQDHSLHYNIVPHHRKLLDYLLSGETLSGDLWTQLLSDRTRNGSSILEHIDEEWKKKTQSSSKQWNILLAHTMTHIYSKAVNMRLLSQQVRWLESVNAKQQYRLSLKEQLAFDIATLSYRNHCGEIISMNEVKAFQEKKKVLYDEDVRLVCDLDLHLAVQLTHFFGFAFAKNLMKPWETEPTHTIGINKKGRVLSTLGQQNAFISNNSKAISYFDSALETFSTLCDPRERYAEQRHTRSYKVCTMIDTPEISNEDIERELLLLSPDHDDMNQLCIQLASSNDDATKYIHHLAVRYLYFRSPHSLIDVYLDMERQWKDDRWHPWTWINMYRGLLLHERNTSNANTWMNKAINYTSQDGIEGLIRVTFMLVQNHTTSPQLHKNLQSYIDNVRMNIPHAKSSISILESIQERENSDPRMWIPKVLPFNFH